jgi:hypothetical protein
MSRAVRNRLRRAAELMHDKRDVDGACSAIYRANGGSWGAWYGQQEEAFQRMFKPSTCGVLPYWFGGHHPQTGLIGRAAVEAREHRVYALLLCAEAHEEFL